ncbi:Appr-1-p processing protein [Alienimonas sp. DA493]|uniref:Appr-1-p processing protein n=1 Tax=Alienimonas sp. DA493 TaxID=3373605 RepID=UPI00375403DB
MPSEPKTHPLEYHRGDLFEFLDTLPNHDRFRVDICHVVNDVGAWGAGFTRPLTAWFPLAEKRYREEGRLPLGSARSWTNMDDLGATGRLVCVQHLYAQRGLIGPGNPRPVRYAALAAALGTVACRQLNVGLSVDRYLLPAIGCGLAGGEWSVVAPLIRATLCEVAPVTVCLLPGEFGRFVAADPQYAA